MRWERKVAKNELEQKLYDLIISDGEGVEGTYQIEEKYDWSAYYKAYEDWKKSVGPEYWKHDMPENLTPENFMFSEPKYTDETIDFEEGAVNFAYTLESYKKVTVDNLGVFEYVDNYGGEGQGDSYWLVFKFTPAAGTEGRTFKIDGYYQSYDGGYYDELYEVFPKQVMVTQWEATEED
jgi:hypothetical protein